MCQSRLPCWMLTELPMRSALHLQQAPAGFASLASGSIRICACGHDMFLIAGMGSMGVEVARQSFLHQTAWRSALRASPMATATMSILLQPCKRLSPFLSLLLLLAARRSPWG